MYRYISSESCSPFDSSPLIHLTDASQSLQLAAITSAAAAVKACLRPSGRGGTLPASSASGDGGKKRLDAYAEFKRASRAYRNEMIDAMSYVRHCFSNECFATPSQRALGLEKLPLLVADDIQVSVSILPLQVCILCESFSQFDSLLHTVFIFSHVQPNSERRYFSRCSSCRRKRPQRRCRTQRR